MQRMANSHELAGLVWEERGKQSRTKDFFFLF